MRDNEAPSLQRHIGPGVQVLRGRRALKERPGWSETRKDFRGRMEAGRLRRGSLQPTILLPDVRNVRFVQVPLSGRLKILAWQLAATHVRSESRGDVVQSKGHQTGPCGGNERRVGGMTDLTETTRRMLLPTKGSANWRCSDCAWSQPFVRRLEVIPNIPSKAIEDAFNRHKCTEHRHPKWNKA